MIRKILAGVGTIAVAAAVLIGGTGAFFTDREVSSGNTFAAGVIDLMVDNESYYNGAVSEATTWLDPQNLDQGQLFFNFTDLKPDDEGEDTISLHIGTNDAWACMDITLTSDDDNSSNEPELATGDAQDIEEDAWDGELAQYLNFVWWADDGDNVLEVDEPLLTSPEVQTLENLATTSGPFSVALADSENNVWTEEADSPIPANETQYVGKGWCFGTLSLSPVAQDDLNTSGPLDGRGTGFVCDGETLGNETQTDGVTLDVSFRAMQSRHNQDFLCSEPEEPPVIACTLEQSYADAMPVNFQGTRKNGTVIPPERSNPAFALGAPQSTGSEVDAGIPVNTFFSLGFATTSASSSIVVAFNDNVIVDGPGADLRLWEVTNGVYPDEHVRVEVANSLVGPWFVVAADAVRDEEIDIAPSGLSTARYVRITDISNPATFSDAIADGYDLDAVQALNCAVSPVQ